MRIYTHTLSLSLSLICRLVQRIWLILLCGGDSELIITISFRSTSAFSFSKAGDKKFIQTIVFLKVVFISMNEEKCGDILWRGGGEGRGNSKLVRLTFYCGFISNMLDVSSFISSLEVISVIFVSSIATL